MYQKIDINIKISCSNKMMLNKEDSDKVVGEIYKITNTVNGKFYIGQTRTHRLNHNKYRPFGYLGRFKDHIHEANSNKKNQSRYLNLAILKYGKDSFTCDLLLTCPISELNMYESKYISEYNSKYPNGYNLTNGGKCFADKDGNFVWNLQNTEPKPKVIMNKSKSDYTKKLISDRLKSSLENNEQREKMMKLTQKQHLSNKFQVYRNITVDVNKINDYIRVIKNNNTNTEYVRITINNKRTTFVGKYESIENIIIRARNFIVDLIQWQRDQIAGNSLELSLPLTLGNICEELG